jgi:hypothetical protein
MSQLTSMGGLYRRRADSAAKEVKAARSELDRAEEVVEACQARLTAQRIEAAQQERDIDAALFRSIVRRRRLDDTLIDLQMIRNATLALETELLQTEQDRDKAGIVLENARARYREQVIKLEKFDALIERETQDANVATQAAEDATLEEAVEMMQTSHEH